MFVIKLDNSLYFYGEIEDDALYSSSKRHAAKFETTEEIDKVVDRHRIEGYSVSTVEGSK